MKVLIIHQFYTTRNEAGISRFDVFSRLWKEAGTEVEVLTGRVNYFTGERSEEAGKETGIQWVWSSDCGLGYRTFVGRMCSYLTFTVSAFFAGLAAPRPDVIVASSPPISVGFVAALIASARGVPFVFEVRDMWPDDAIELGFIKNPLLIGISRVLERFLYWRASLVVTNSPGIKDWLVTKKRLSPHAVGVVENPVETPKNADREALRKRFGWGEKTVFVYAGSHSFVYDFDLALDVAKELEREPILFVFVGDGRQKPHLMARVAAEGLANVVALPPVPSREVAEYLAAADAGFVTLKGFPRLRFVYATKVFDYMAAALPMVIAMEGVTAELARNAHAGICVPPGDRRAFLEAIRALAGEKGRRKKLGENGKKYLDTHYRASDLARRYLEILKPLVVPER